MKLSWEDAQTFLLVCEQRSFSAAARKLDLGQPAISRRIKNLEQQLGSQLFIRGKQGATPTEAALKLIPAAEQMARWAVEFDRTAMGVEQGLKGKVTIAAPPGISVEHLAPFATILRSEAPQISLEILSSVAHLDLARGEADLAIRTRRPTEPELVSIYESSSPTGVFASAEYAASIKQPCHWQDLDWITWSDSLKYVAPRPMLEKLIPDFEPSFCSDDYLVQIAAVVEGLGALIMSYPALKSPAESSLVEIDVGVQLAENKFYIVCAKSMEFVPRVAITATHLIHYLDQHKQENSRTKSTA